MGEFWIIYAIAYSIELTILGIYGITKMGSNRKKGGIDT